MLRPQTTWIWRSLLCLWPLLLSQATVGAVSQPLAVANAEVQDKMVKVYGVGGIRGLEAYQSGFLVSGEGHVLTAWSYVLDTDDVTVVLNDGRRFTGKLQGADPRLEIALLKIEATALPHFDLAQAVKLRSGDRVLAFCNLYGIAAGTEATSLLQGYVSAVAPLAARRGVFQTPYQGPVYIVDAMTNNAGAAGGALTDHRGHLAGMLGKELRDARSNVWLNYALPIDELRESVSAILDGKTRPRSESMDRRPDEFLTLDLLGLVMLPDVLPKTPPYIQSVVANSAASNADLKPDDLIVMVGDTVIQSRRQLVEELSFIDRLDPVPLTVLRDQELVPAELVLKANSTSPK